MDDIIEIVLERFFDVVGEVTFESKRLKTWVKTVLFSILGGAIVAVFGLITFSCAQDGEPWQIVTLSALTVLMLAFVIWGAIRGHKRNWHHD